MHTASHDTQIQKLGTIKKDIITKIQVKQFQLISKMLIDKNHREKNRQYLYHKNNEVVSTGIKRSKGYLKDHQI